MKTYSHLRRVILALLVAVGCLPHWVSARQAAPVHAAQSDAALDLVLTREAQRLLDLDRMEKSQPSNVTVKARADIAGKRLIIDFGSGFLPAEDDSSTEQIEQEISASLRHYMERAVLEEVQVEVLYEGRSFNHYFPMPEQRDKKASATAPGAVLVSASHGWIRVHPSGAWELQRPLLHGIQEDLITPGYADELQQLLQERGGATVYRARRGGQELHPESQHPWVEMSSRYHLKSLLPERTDIWNHFANSTERNREVKDDIRARPYYANHLGVEGLISIHTNGNRNEQVRGTEVYYHPAKPNDRELASLMLCSMKELITSQVGYESFPVRVMPLSANHGENRFAEMPSVVVEVAYHSNALDAVALQDPIFRAASMKGVEKGYRLWASETACVPFELGAIVDAQMPPLSSVDVPVPFAGNPQFPVIAELTVAGCDEVGACEPYQQTLEEAASPLMLRLACNGSGHGTAAWSTVLRDADGVVTNPVKHLQICGNG